MSIDDESSMTGSAAPDTDRARRQWAEWRTSRRRVLGTTALAAGALALNGATPLFSPVNHAAAQDAEPKMGGKIAMSLADDDVTTFDPIIPTDNMAIWTMVLIYDQLIRVGPDGLSLEPGLAESWTLSDDAKTYTFKLRAAKFHDGTACTAHDAEFCITRAAGKDATNWGFLFSAIDTVKATDDSTLVITLKTPWAPFEADLALFGASIYPAAAYKAQGDKLWDHPIGTGPFTFDSWEKGSQITLKKYAEYWDAPKPYLDELDFYVLTDANARMLQFQSGDLDIVTDVPFNQLDPLKQDPSFEVHTEGAARIDYLGINVTRDVLNDKTLRQAMNYAINNDAIIQNVLFNAGKQANTYLPLMAGHDDKIAPYPFDLAKAKELVAQSAGKNGFSFEIIVDVGDPVASQVAQLVSAQLAEIGGKITITQLEPGINTERVHGMDYDVYKSYYTTDVIDPDELTVFAVLSDGGTQAVWTGYKNEDVDKLIREAQLEMDKTKRQALYSQIQQLHHDDAPMIFLYYPTGRSASHSYVKNFKVLPTGNYRLFETWRDDV